VDLNLQKHLPSSHLLSSVPQSLPISSSRLTSCSSWTLLEATASHWPPPLMLKKAARNLQLQMFQLPHLKAKKETTSYLQLTFSKKLQKITKWLIA